MIRYICAVKPCFVPESYWALGHWGAASLGSASAGAQTLSLSLLDPSSSVRRCLRPPPSSPTDVAPSFERRCGAYICVVCVPIAPTGVVCVPHGFLSRTVARDRIFMFSSPFATLALLLEGNPLTSLILAKQQLLSKPYKSGRDPIVLWFADFSNPSQAAIVLEALQGH
ncbi:hypothetical protein Taro_052509 [Colocasia esculenta]|uniref:Uncharacterized protein n=1 Tax=Colocasia esculenta TaxID=4460 RepID=A0A843XJY4_COLES|nr:hypothetical protein [Colocasia esculenta]